MMTPEVRDVLCKVRDEVLTDESRWTKEAYGRDIDRTELFDGSDASAVCWCLIGAIEKATGSEWNPLRGQCIGALERRQRGLIDWNDAPERTFDDVRVLLDKALAEEIN